MADPRSKVRAAAVLGLTAVVLLTASWLDDDAFVTLRTADNVLNGHGLTWNPAERVQAYTHPLWLFLNTGLAALTGRPELTCALLSFILSLAVVGLILYRVAPSLDTGLLAVLLLLVSKAWVDFSGSGLEDPLTRLLLVLFVLAGRRPAGDARALVVALITALAALSRPDALLVFLPALAAELRGGGRRRWCAAALGLAPLAAWGLFALLYYGSPWPNTAYAKLGTGVPRIGRVVQGFAYLFDSLIRDPATLGILVAAVWVAWRWPRRVDRRLLAGGLLYLAYVVWIGGGYMSGRFLGLPLTAAVLALLRDPPPARVLWTRRKVVAVALSLAAVALAVRTVEPLMQDGVGLFGIGDERRTHHPYTGLTGLLVQERWPEHFLRLRGEELARDGTEVWAEGAIGMVGFYAGPEVHLVDVFALGDPLLARLPGEIRATFNRPRELGWRAGHVRRAIPEGYLESLPGGPNRLADPDLARYYDVIRTVTRGPLWDRERLATVVRLNLGHYDALVDAWAARRAETETP